MSHDQFGPGPSRSGSDSDPFGVQDRPDEISSSVPAALPWQPVTTIVPSGAAEDSASAPADSSRRRWALAGGAGVVALALVGGVTYAVGALSGGGAQPAESLPAGAVGYVSIDLDPAAGQKIDGFQYLRSFPSLKDKVPVSGDVRKIFFEAVEQDAGWSGIDYDRDVAPWLGKRIALAAYPGSGKGAAGMPTAVVALQITDRGAAGAGLARLQRASTSSADAAGQRIGWAFSGDYALLSDTAAHAQHAAEQVADGTLAADAHFSSDLAAMPDGVATAWIDGDKASSVLGQGGAAILGGGLLGGAADLGGLAGAAGSVAGSGTTATGTGRATVVARFDGGHVFEVSGRVTGATTAGWSTHAVAGVADLPADSVLAMGISDPDLLLAKTYASLTASLQAQGMNLDDMTTSLAGAYGISLPADLETLLGHNLVLSVSGSGGDGVPAIAARMRTDPAAAGAVVTKVRKALEAQGVALPITTTTVGDDLIIASSKAAARGLAGGAGARTLGANKGFTDAMSGLADADVALWMDPQAVMSAMGSSNKDQDLAAIAGIGLTASSRATAAGSDKATTTFTFRLVTR